MSFKSRLEIGFNREKSRVKIGKKFYTTESILQSVLEVGDSIDVLDLYSKEKSRDPLGEGIKVYKELLDRGIKECKCWKPQVAVIVDDIIIPYPSVILVSDKLKDTIFRVPNKELLKKLDNSILGDIL